jgi:hypothetical protein
VIQGQQSGSRITHLGLLHVLEGQGTHWRREWVVREAVRALNEVAESLHTADRKSLSKYINIASRAQRVSSVMLQDNPLRSGRVEAPFLDQRMRGAPPPPPRPAVDPTV